MKKQEKQLRIMIRNLISEINLDKFKLPSDIDLHNYTGEFKSAEDLLGELERLVAAEEEAEETIEDDEPVEDFENESEREHSKKFWDMYNKQMAGKKVDEDEGIWPYNVYPTQTPNPSLRASGADSGIAGEAGGESGQRMQRTKIVKDDEGNETEISKRLRVIQSKEIPNLSGDGTTLSRYKFIKKYGKVAAAIARIMINKGMSDSQVVALVKEKYELAKASGKPFTLGADGRAAKDAPQVDITISKLLKKIVKWFKQGMKDSEIIKKIIEYKADPSEVRILVGKIIREMLSTGDLAVGGGEKTIEDPEGDNENEENEEETITEENIPYGYSLEGKITDDDLMLLATKGFDNSGRLWDEQELLSYIEKTIEKELTEDQIDLVINNFFGELERDFVSGHKYPEDQVIDEEETFDPEEDDVFSEWI